jgi:two-component system, NarL family, response regulator NreC
MSVRILIADDHGVLRAGLRTLLHGVADIQVVGEAGTGEEALQLADQVQPDLVLLDISMPGLDGLEVTRRLKDSWPATRVLIMTMHEDTGLLREALRAGAAGYIVKRAVESELITAIQAVHRGELYVHPSLTRGLFQDLTPAPPARLEVEALTPRELDVLRLLALGHTNRQIAQVLSLSVRTVESHRSSIVDKLGLRTRAELAQYAAEHHLWRPGK